MKYSLQDILVISIIVPISLSSFSNLENWLTNNNLHRSNNLAFKVIIQFSIETIQYSLKHTIDNRFGNEMNVTSNFRPWDLRVRHWNVSRLRTNTSKSFWSNNRERSSGNVRQKDSWTRKAWSPEAELRYNFFGGESSSSGSCTAGCSADTRAGRFPGRVCFRPDEGQTRGPRSAGGLASCVRSGRW